MQPPRSSVPPAGRHEWAGNPIDAFVRAKLQANHIEPAHAADRSTLVRRVTFDLVGLPPTPEEMDRARNDKSPEWFERLIDRLLASPHYGERWGRHWLDVARFSESDGFENDKLRDHAWHYRDYVIRSFNDDKPYDLLIKEQLAGDARTPVTRDGLIATGFLVAGPWDEIQNVAKSPTEKKRAHEEQLEELIAAVSQTFLGLTVNCARCHDHKFDPIPQADYYRLKAVFDGVDHGNRPLMTPDEQKEHDVALAPLRKRIESLKHSLIDVEKEMPGDAIAEKLETGALVEGRFGKALDVTKGRAVAKSKAAYHTPPLTVECWAKLRGKSGFNVLVANDAKESSTHWEVYSYAGSGEFSAYLPGYEPAEIKSGIDITDDRWHYLAMTFDGQRARLFIDAKLVKDAAVTKRGGAETVGSIYLGGYPPQNIGCDGVLDEVRIANTVRVIERIPDAPFPADAATVGLWHLDRADGNRFEDSSIEPGQASARKAARERHDALAFDLKFAEAAVAATAPPLAYFGMRRQPEPTFVLLRGDIQKPGPQVTAATLTAIHTGSNFQLPADAPESQRRLQFSEWVASPDSPLTARVLVNRVWQHYFGQGLVETPSDFGFNGGHPSHPELLDWLARDFIEHGWSIKRVHRLILTSATYLQAAASNEQARKLDADNRLLWHFAPRRLEAEAVRDAMLAVSGDLNSQLGGPSFRPFTLTVQLHNFYHPLDQDTPDFNRRTVYRMNVNTGKSPFLDALDCPAPSLTIPRRRHTTTPLQALALMNDSFVQRQAAHFAERVRRTTPESDAQIARAYRLAFGREPTADERALSVKLQREHGLDSVCWALLNASEFLHIR